MSANNWPHVLNLSNSIIGVTVLAMPFCFKECGVVLGVVLLFFSTWLTLTSCQLLMKAGITSRRRSYGFLAYYTHGAPGKFAVEVGMIGLQIGTLIAQVVIIGDLGPAIISKITGLQNSSHLRTALIVLLCLCVGLPLGLLKNLTTLSHASSLCIMFYTFFVLYVMSLSAPNLLKGEWYNKVNVWRTEGLFKCLPIFSFAFGCQTQLFILYDALPEPSLKTMNSIVGSAVNMCTVAYLLVGFFGYVAFCDTDITGDIITHFDTSLVSDILKIGFVISIAITFPLIIFPCRSSLYTMLFPQKPKHDEDIEQQRPVLPEMHFKVITTAIVLGAMITGILVPNVEFVLAMNGATMGTLICYIFPAMFFLRVMTSSSDGKSLAQLVFIFGFTIMLLCTYTTLNSQDVPSIQPAADIMDKPKINEDKRAILEPPKLADVKPVKDDSIEKKPPDKGGIIKDDTRREPPNPKEPIEPDNINKSDLKKVEGRSVSIKQDKKLPTVSVKVKDSKEIDKAKVEKGEEKVKVKEDRVDEKAKDKEAVDQKQKELIQQLEKQQKESKKLLEEQKQILEELKQHKEEVHKKDLEEKQQKQEVQQEQQAGIQGQQVQQPVKPQQQQQQLPVGQQGVNQAQQQPVAIQQGQQVGNQQLGQQVQVGQQAINQVPQQAPIQGQQVNQQGSQQLAFQGQNQAVGLQGQVGQQKLQVGQGAAQQVGQQGVAQQVGQQGVAQQVGQQGAAQQVVQQFGQQPLIQAGQQIGIQGQQLANQGQQKAEGVVAQQVFQQGGQQQQPLQAGQQAINQVPQAGQQVINQIPQAGQQGLPVQQGAQGNNLQPNEQKNIGGNNQQVQNVVKDNQQFMQQNDQGQGQMKQPMNSDQGQNVKNMANEAANIDEQKLLNLIQQDQSLQNKPLNRGKRDTNELNNLKDGEKQIVKSVDGNDLNKKKSEKNMKNEEMRRKKLSVDDNDALLYEALERIEKDVSRQPVLKLGAVRSLKSKQE